MSAFVVSKEHIDTLVSVAIQLAPRRAIYTREHGNINVHNADEIGQVLHSENVKSVNYRYQGSAHIAPTIDDEYRYTRRRLDVLHDIVDTRVRNIAQAFKAIRCYEYQSCEHPGWEGSEAKWFCDALSAQLMNALPGYGDAEWEIRDAA
jgi:hypothetical protein